MILSRLSRVTSNTIDARKCLSYSATTSADMLREYYPHFEERQTRWNDMDAFSHVNNVMYYSFMDDAVNEHLYKHGIGSLYPRFVAESGCRYLRPISYPDRVHVGLRVSQLGKSSVKYDIGIFDGDNKSAAAIGHFVHVYVSKAGKPVTMDKRVHEILEELK